MHTIAILLTAALLPSAALAQTAPSAEPSPTATPTPATPQQQRAKRTHDRHPHHTAPKPQDPAARTNQPGSSADSMNRPETTPTHGTEPDDAEGPR
jgi:hypothetical protein